jgi:hypothetical protein
LRAFFAGRAGGAMKARMDRPVLSPALVSAIVFAALAWLLLIGQELARRLRRRRLRLQMQRARAGEQAAPQLLRDLGYRVIGSQVSSAYALSLDAEPVSIAVRADFLVERDGLRFVAEVKTGLAAPRIQTAGTRRQLLEYRVAFEVDGVLLVDVEAQRAHVVRFPFEGRDAPSSSTSWTFWAFAAMAIALGIVAWAGHLGAL